MKKAALITIHAVANFGSVLQTYATQCLLENLGYEVSVINYIAPRLMLKYKLHETFIENKDLKLYQRFSTIISSKLFNRIVFDCYLRKHIRLTKRYYSLEELKTKLPHFDIYISGSDQVWNSYYNKFIDPVYFLDFAPDGCKRISFASSFGREKLNDTDEENATQKLLSRYNDITVRENSAVRILKELGFNNVEQLLDPTLLIDKSEWEKVASPKMNKERYVLIYPMSIIDPALITIAKGVAERINAKIYLLSAGLKNYHECHKTLKFKSPETFLSLINHAEFIVTNSFHGTAFSINFNKQFISVPSQKFNTRIKSVLELTGLPDRLFNNQIDYEQILNPIDYSLVNKILADERQKATQFLKKI